MNDQAASVEWSGYCPICERATTFRADGSWFRDALHCVRCQSIPRERAVMLAITRHVPDWKTAFIHESSPVMRGTSARLARECGGYVATQFWPDVTPGTMRYGYRCEDLEAQTFPDETFDLVVTQDVMEHVFEPEAVYKEIWRTLKPGGWHIHTTPMFKDLIKTERWARRRADRSIEYIHPAEYHGNPLSNEGSLVTFHYGYDLPELIAGWAPFSVELSRHVDRNQGLFAEFMEVLVCRKVVAAP